MNRKKALFLCKSLCMAFILTLLAGLLPGNAASALGPLGGFNVVLNRPVSVPSTQNAWTRYAQGTVSPYVARRAIDGSTQPQSYWYTTHSDKSLTVFLSDVYYINRWVVTGINKNGNTSLYPANFNIKVSLDGVNWKTVDIVTNNTQQTCDRTFPTIKARYVKLQVTYGNQTNNIWTAIKEFSVYSGYVCMGDQTGVLSAGGGESATFAVTTADIPDGSHTPTFTWYYDADGFAEAGAPAWASPSLSNVLSDSATVTMATTNSSVAGTYYYRVSIDGKLSNVIPLVVTKPSYNVTFLLNGGMRTGGGELTQTIEQGSAATAPTVERVGYAFSGWDVDFGSITQPQSVTAQWTANTYTIAYNANGGTSTTASSSHTYGVPQGLTTNGFTRAGYAFAGWSTSEGGVKVYNDGQSVTNLTDQNGGIVPLYAVWTVNDNTPYKVEHYKQNTDGSYPPIATETENRTGTTDTAAAATANTYVGFGEDVSHTSRVASGNIAGDGSLLLKLYYRRYTYTIVYNANGGTSTTASSSHTYGVPQGLTANGFTRAGYAFAGWSTSEGGVKVYNDGQSVTSLTDQNGGSVTLYAVWTVNDNTPYKVEHYKQNTDGTYPPIATETENRTGTTDTAAAATANTYVGFGEDVSHTSRVASGNIAGDGSLLLKLYYRRYTYTIVYNANGGTSTTASSSHTYGVPQGLTANGFTRAGYAFAGWSTSEGGVKVYNDGQSVTSLTDQNGGSVTLYAVWTVNDNTPYKVEHYKQNTDGTYPPIATETENRTGTTDTTAAAAAKTYVGFGEDVSHTSRVASGNIAGDGSLLLKLYYSRYTYTVAYNANGGTSTTASSSHTYGVPQGLTTNGFTRAGYAFAGWSTSEGGVKVYNDGQSVTSLTDQNGGIVTLYAAWTANDNTPYIVEHYKQNTNGTYPPIATETENRTGTTDTTAAAAAKTYVGFGEDVSHTGRVASGNIAGDGSLLLKLYYSRKTYTVTFDAQGGSAVVDRTALHDAHITAPANPVRSGYRLEGWYTEPAFVTAWNFSTNTVTDNITLYAKWRVQSNPPTVPPPPPVEEPLQVLVMMTYGGTTSSSTSIAATLNTVNSTVSANLSPALAQNLIDEALKAKAAGKKAVVAVKFDAIPNATAVNLEIPRSEFRQMAAAKTTLQFDSGMGSMTLGSRELASIGRATALGSIRLGIEAMDSRTLSPSEKKKVGDKPVYRFAISAGDTSIRTISGSIKITLPYTQKAGENKKWVTTYYVDSKGKLRSVTGRYDPKTGTVSFSLSRF